MRLFAAAFITQKIAEKMYEYCEPSAEYFKFKRVPPEKMHVTVKYFGDEDYENCLKIVEKSVKDIEKFEIAVKGVNFFSRGKYAGVLWAGIYDKTSSLNKIALNIDGSLKSYIAHITLARFKNGIVENSVLDKYLSENSAKEKEFGNFTVERIVLADSILEARASRYKILKEFCLR
ncbi:MAG: RNA 2',3'-cyclic phosphodiesterase [Endomicrobium sp.]|jgi:2'-5' RNA ligase|nr:RNA 2',3'-cyclic phosphodiesterase [Endomicrobium sp.]